MTYQQPITRADADGRSLEERAAERFGLGLPFRATPGVIAPVDAAGTSAPPQAGAAARPSTPAPATPGAVQRVDRALLEAAGAIVPDGSVSGLAEEMRIIKRQMLRAMTADHPAAHANRILIASANPGEGKTFTAVNLALSIAAESDFEALLVDADFAKPSVVAALGLDGGPGLMDALADPAQDVAKLIIPTDVPGLSVLPAGQATLRDSELLAAANTRAILRRLEEGRPGRVVIFDSPPVLAASPAAVLAGHVGRVVVVVRADRTTEASLRDAVGLLGAADDLQLLLNGVKFTPGGRRFGTYYGKGART